MILVVIFNLINDLFFRLILHFAHKLNKSKYVHKVCSPGIVTQEADVAIQPVNTFFIFENAVP